MSGERSAESIAQAITKFAADNNLKIHPGQEPLKWGQLVMSKGGCPCVPDRSECPCDFVLDDIKEINRCRCGLFCNDGYLEEYNKLRNEAKPAKSWRRKQGRSS